MSDSSGCASEAVAFIHWLNTFDGVDIKAASCEGPDDAAVWRSFDALADGVALMHAMRHISPDHADLPDGNASERIESIVLVLEVYFERDLANLDASAIAMPADASSATAATCSSASDE